MIDLNSNGNQEQQYRKDQGRLKCYLFTFCKTQPGLDKQMDSYRMEILHKIVKLSIGWEVQL